MSAIDSFWKWMRWIGLGFCTLFLVTCGYAFLGVASEEAPNELAVAAAGDDRESGAATELLVNGEPYGVTPSSPKAPTNSPNVASPLTAKVIAFQCEDSPTGDYVITKLTIQNTGSVEIHFANSIVQLANSAGEVLAVENGHFGSIPPGSIKTATTMSRNSDQIKACNYIVQDRRGNAVELQGK